MDELDNVCNLYFLVLNGIDGDGGGNRLDWVVAAAVAVVVVVVVAASAVVLLSALTEEDAEDMEEEEEEAAEEDDGGDDEFFGVLFRVFLLLWPPKMCWRWTALLAANFSQNLPWYLL